MPGEISFREFVRLFAKHGINVVQNKGTSHFSMFRKVGDITFQYTGAIKGGKKVKPIYLKEARKRFGLLDDKTFYGKK